MSYQSVIHKDFDYTEDVHAFYEREGYHVFERFLSEEGLARCLNLIDEMMDRLQPGRSPLEIFSPHQQENWIFNLATEPKILDMIERQIGSDIVLWSSHFVCKAPGLGDFIPWHQDAPYWNVSGRLAAGLWIAFDHTDPENGTMSILPGWHKKGKLPIVKKADQLFEQQIDSQVLPDNLEELKVEYRLKPGHAAIHDTMIPHHSVSNDSDRWRRVLVLRYMSAGGTMGTKEYEDYRTGAMFPREYYLVRGRDVKEREMKYSPFQT
jgi:phytanoyl-CoA hydroxylase